MDRRAMIDRTNKPGEAIMARSTYWSQDILVSTDVEIVDEREEDHATVMTLRDPVQGTHSTYVYEFSIVL